MHGKYNVYFRPLRKGSVIFCKSFVFTDVNECNDGGRGCGTKANCTISNGSQNCTCKEGYTGDGQSCQGIIFALN